MASPLLRFSASVTFPLVLLARGPNSQLQGHSWFNTDSDSDSVHFSTLTPVSFPGSRTFVGSMHHIVCPSRLCFSSSPQLSSFCSCYPDALHFGISPLISNRFPLASTPLPIINAGIEFDYIKQEPCISISSQLSPHLHPQWHHSARSTHTHLALGS